MKIFTRTLLFIALMSTSGIPGKSQEVNEYIYRPFQLTLITPLSTNGFDSKDCVNKISLNLLWGVNAGLQGIEYGGIANIETDFVEGFQYAGFGNFNRGALYGVSGAGFMNTASEVKGLQSAGFMNITKQLTGAQFAGFMNISDFVRGAQISDFMNIAEEVHGVQAAGFMNIAENVKGTQIGFINIADNYEAGVPIGFINIVKNGYHDFEIAGSEIWNLNFGYRLGVDRLYTQFMMGSRWDPHDKFWGFGVGLGTRFDITGYFKGSLDLTSYQLVEHRHLYAQHPNLLEQLRLTFEGKIFGDLKWFIGPSFNLLITPFEYTEPAFLEHFDPWTVYENTGGGSYLKMWPGISGGIRF